MILHQKSVNICNGYQAQEHNPRPATLVNDHTAERLVFQHE